jgi:hypothetical protein
MKDFDPKYLYLPKKFWVKHDQCELMVNQIEEFLTDETYGELRVQKINLPTDALINDDENVLDYLIRIKKFNEYDRLIQNTLINALLGDTCYFLQEAISCSKKKRLSVTFALLRKPFIDHLIVFLRIMFDDNFFEKFNNEASFEAAKVDEENKRTLIKKSLPYLIAAKSFTETELYDMIFNKDEPESILNLSNKALHLSTTRNKKNMTDIQNLNFIFANQKDIENLWEFLYNRLPALLIYYSEVIDALIFNILDLPDSVYTNRMNKKLEILMK